MRRRVLLATPAAAAVAFLPAPAAHAAASAGAGAAVRPTGDRIRERVVRPIAGLAREDGRPARTGAFAPVTAAAEKSHQLTIVLLDRTGRTAGAANHPAVFVSNLDYGDVYYWGPPATVELPAGRYAITADVATARVGGDPSYSIITVAETSLDCDRTVVLDARLGHPVSVEADDPAADGGAYDVTVYTRVSDQSFVTALHYVFDPRFDQVYAATVPGTQSSTYAFGQARRATEPQLELTVTGSAPYAVRVDWLDGGATAWPEQADLTAVHAGAGTAEDLDGLEVAGRLVIVELPGDIAYDQLMGILAMIRERDARLVLVIPRGDASGFAAGDLSELPLPVLVGWGVTADRLAAARAGVTAVAYASRPMPQLRYELAYGMTGQLICAQVHRPRTADLAAIPASYHDAAPDAARFLSAATPFFGSTLRVMWSRATAVPQRRVEFFTPGQWELYVSPYGRPGAITSEVRDLHAGANPPIAWDKAVTGPSLRGTTRTRAGERPWAWRDGSAIDVILPMLADAAGRPAVAAAAADTGSISLHCDGVLVGRVDAPDAARFAIGDEPATYQLEAVADRDQPWWPLAIRVSAQWTFRSSSADEGKPLPLLTIRFDPAVDLRNQAPGGPFAFPAYVERQGGGVADATLAVEVSFDDGTSWRPAGVIGSAGRFLVSVVQPGSGHVSLRATAGADGTVRQTVIRAYALGR